LTNDFHIFQDGYCTTKQPCLLDQLKHFFPSSIFPNEVIYRMGLAAALRGKVDV
jgi:hypothetical protein